MPILKIGDTVNWRGGFGNQPAENAKVIGIEVSKNGGKYGKSVQEVEWSNCCRNVVVDLDNGHWAYGNQISEKLN